MSGCFFYDRDPKDVDAVKFDLIDENGCNDSPNYYNPFAAATEPGVNGMYLNQKPIDKELTEGKPRCFCASNWCWGGLINVVLDALFSTARKIFIESDFEGPVLHAIAALKMKGTLHRKCLGIAYSWIPH